ncbi:MAG: copper-binding protein [Acidimicrobiales bacterium]|nr:copper-binding protein [Acidimicrobiales bacterium]
MIGIVLIGLGALLGCASDSPGSLESATTGTFASPDEVTVRIERSRFLPADVDVAVGDTVVFENSDPFAHTVTSRPSSTVVFDSGSMVQGDRFEFDAERVGEFEYFCEVHPTMRATVIVR